MNTLLMKKIKRLFLASMVVTIISPILGIFLFLGGKVDTANLFMILTFVFWLFLFILTSCWLKQFQQDGAASRWWWAFVVLFFPTVGPVLFYLLVMNKEKTTSPE